MNHYRYLITSAANHPVYPGQRINHDGDFLAGCNNKAALYADNLVKQFKKQFGAAPPRKRVVLERLYRVCYESPEVEAAYVRLLAHIKGDKFSSNTCHQLREEYRRALDDYSGATYREPVIGIYE